MPVVEAFRNAVSLLDELRAGGTIKDYALIGGLALSAWTRPRTTRDVDVVVLLHKDVSWKNLSSDIEHRFHKRVFLQEGNQRTHIKEKLSFIFGQIEIDLISARGFKLAQKAIEHALPTDVFDKRVKVATPEYLILLKLLPLSEQDSVDIKRLLKKADIKKVIELAKTFHLTVKLEPFLKN
ncbi:MAG: nucleotidyl transferase AbiEii/AbiGii toxin family protein [Thermodesulfovibrionales bacterium]|nr:nucleotidyl transferase AbiEii/AbiGii toxin family protein [Thermodesulfovibrionales bacterium]